MLNENCNNNNATIYVHQSAIGTGKTIGSLLKAINIVNQTRTNVLYICRTFEQTVYAVNILKSITKYTSIHCCQIDEMSNDHDGGATIVVGTPLNTMSSGKVKNFSTIFFDDADKTT